MTFLDPCSLQEGFSSSESPARGFFVVGITRAVCRIFFKGVESQTCAVGGRSARHVKKGRRFECGIFSFLFFLSSVRGESTHPLAGGRQGDTRGRAGEDIRWFSCH